jgi:hypothetical protein
MRNIGYTSAAWGHLSTNEVIYPLVAFPLYCYQALLDKLLKNSKNTTFVTFNDRSLFLFVDDDEVIEIKTIFSLWMTKCCLYLRFNRLVVHTYVLFSNPRYTIFPNREVKPSAPLANENRLAQVAASDTGKTPIRCTFFRHYVRDDVLGMRLIAGKS